MGEQRQNSPTVLRDSGKGLSETAQRLAEEWERLKAESADLDGIFGDGEDDVGGILRMIYEGVHNLADESFTSSVKSFTEFGEKLRRIGDLDEETEQRNAEILTELQKALDGLGQGGA